MNLLEKAKLLPTKPGSYQMLDSHKKVIYVGKTKNLRNRVSSYFKGDHDPKTNLLVDNIYDFTFTVTNTEMEALILEQNLIKKYNPKYNILLTDDKSYPYILFDRDKLLLEVVRPRKKVKGILYGPFPNANAASLVVRILNRVYPLRKCNPLQKDYCLYYHIGECLGYCKNKIDPDTKQELIDKVTSFFNGDDKTIRKELNKRMNDASSKLNYEEALEYKTMLDSIDTILKRQNIDIDTHRDFDLVNYYSKDIYMAINTMIVRKGKLMGSTNKIFRIVSGELEMLEDFIVNYYNKAIIKPNMLMVPEGLDTNLLSEYLDMVVKVPYRGKIAHLLELSKTNAKVHLENETANIAREDKAREAAIEELNSILNKDIKRIEAFDNSHLFGTYYVGAMVVFDWLKPNKKLYRKYKIKSDCKDDITAMKEVLYRRYSRMILDNEEAPDLLLVDGGKAQVSIAREVLDNLHLDIDIVGLKKDDNHKTKSLILSDLTEIDFKKGSSLYIYLAKIQEEVHRFVINYHRNIRSKGMFNSVLDDIEGVGKTRKREILKRYPSISSLKKATLADLESFLPEAVAKSVYEFASEYEI